MIPIVLPRRLVMIHYSIAVWVLEFQFLSTRCFDLSLSVWMYSEHHNGRLMATCPWYCLSLALGIWGINAKRNSSRERQLIFEHNVYLRWCSCLRSGVAKPIHPSSAPNPQNKSKQPINFNSCLNSDGKQVFVIILIPLICCHNSLLLQRNRMQIM